jgi:hypothetical protein
MSIFEATMKKLLIPALAGMTLTEAALERTPPSEAAQSAYDFTLIAVFAPPSAFGLVPSILAEGPVITNDGTVVYSAGLGGIVKSSIFSSDGTVTRLLVPLVDHAFSPLATAVSGNGMMVTNQQPREIIDVHDGMVVGQLDPGDEFVLGSGPNGDYDVSINNRGSVAFTGGILDPLCVGHPFFSNEGVFRFDGETTTRIATLGDPTDVGLVNWAFPSINERGQVAFLVMGVGVFCPPTPGIEPGDLYIGDGTRLVKIAETSSAPSLNSRGEVGFIGVNGGALSILVSDGTRTRIVADTNGPIADFAGSDFGFIGNHPEVGVSLNDRGKVAFMAFLYDGDVGIFTGPDVVKDKVIATGDLLTGSSVSDVLMSRQGLNNNGQIAFQVTLADGRMVIVRAEPKKAMLN